MANWYKCTGGVWCDLFKLDLTHEYLQGAEGVFVIWTGIKDRKVLRVGSGSITKQLLSIRRDLAIQAFQHLGVFVTWTELSSLKRSGVELFLINELKPTIVIDTPKGIAIKMQLPW